MYFSLVCFSTDSKAYKETHVDTHLQTRTVLLPLSMPS